MIEILMLLQTSFLAVGHDRLVVGIPFFQGGEDVNVNAICPGYVLTPLVEKQIPDTAKARGISEEEVINDVMLSGQPTKKFVTTEELAALALFLASDAAASMTGTALPVDGGWVAQ